ARPAPLRGSRLPQDRGRGRAADARLRARPVVPRPAVDTRLPAFKGAGRTVQRSGTEVGSVALPDIGSSVGHSFGLELDGVQVSGVSDVTLMMEQDVVELKENGPDGKIVVRSLPGRPKAPEITLTRGVTADKT